MFALIDVDDKTTANFFFYKLNKYTRKKSEEFITQKKTSLFASLKIKRNKEEKKLDVNSVWTSLN